MIALFRPEAPGSAIGWLVGAGVSLVRVTAIGH
jgi:hypothetical protein